MLKAYGTPGTFSANLTFTLPEGSISSTDQSTPSNLKLYHRDSNADGNWTLLVSGSSATSTTITFNGVTSFSQFIIASGSSPLPVELTSFSANTLDGKIILNWETATEVNNYGFSIERTGETVSGGNGEWVEIGFVQGSGNSNSPKEYTFVDSIPLAGNLKYRLKQIDTDGSYDYYSTIAEVSFNPTGVNENGFPLPKEFALLQNYPNPFNPATAISYQLSSSSNVTLKIYDVLGGEITTLVSEKQNAGKYSVVFDGGKYSSGVYLYRITADNFVQTKKLLLLK